MASRPGSENKFTLMTPHVEYELEDASEHVGRKTRKFRREYSHEALAVRPLVGSVSSRRGDFLHVIRPAVGAFIFSRKFGRECHAGAKERSANALVAI